MNRKHFPKPSRRKFLATAIPVAAAIRAEAAPKKNPLIVFNKPLQHLSYADQAALVAEMGFDGIEGTVRKGGHVEPADVERDLPKQIEALEANGIDMTLMTTGVNRIDDPVDRRVLETAASLGVKRFRMAPYKYDYDKPIPVQLEEFRKIYRELCAYCAELGIRPLYQNHAGAKYFGASLWDLYLLMKGDLIDETGICFDIRHATVEGGMSWPTEFHLMKPLFGAVYCKDFDWDKEKRRPYNVPLGTGMVDYPKFFSMLKKIGYDGPISLHMEYKDHRDPAVQKESIAAIRKDRETLANLMSQ